MTTQDAIIEEIETARLHLRRPTMADAVTLRELWRNEQVRQFLGGVVSQEVIDGKIASIEQHWNEHGFGQWAVFEKETGRIVGLCGLHRSEEGIELSYMFFPAFWGRGLATEAASASLNHGFRTLAFERIVAITQEVNYSSYRLLEKVGMHHTHTLWRFEAAQRFYELARVEWLA
ncbi:MAG: GNAT family N-acetyltransferase [Ktedonobacteraceae bacterium]